MADVLTEVGEISIETLLPAPVGVLITAMADVQVKLQAMIAFSLQLGLPALSIAAQLELAASITQSLTAAAAIGLTPPSISAQLEITLAVVAQLRALLQIYLDLFALLTASVRVYAYDGTVGGLGGRLTAALSTGFPGGTGSAQHCNALVIATELDASWAAMSAVFRVA